MINRNCYPKCNNYYYFDESDEYKCTDNNECPHSHNKLIEEKRKCINECIYDDTYKYEYNNSCYKECPNNQICKNIIDEDNTTQIKLDKTNHINITAELSTQKITEELTLQITHNIKDLITKTIQINIPKISDTQKITEELTPQITQIIESQNAKETQ